MGKLLAIARREYGAMVATKAFLLSITLMPVLMIGSMVVASRFQKMGDVSDRRLVIVDASGGELYADLQRAAEARNAAIRAAAEQPQDDQPAPRQSRYLLERFPKDALDDADRLALSERVRAGDIKAFVEIPAGVVDMPASSGAPAEVRFYAAAAMFAEERAWIEQVMNDAVKTRRLAVLGIDPAQVAAATARVPVEGRGLLKELGGGRIGGGEGQGMSGVMLPFGFMMLMFGVIMFSAQPVMENVMEEKNGRIAEVLLGSVNAFQLMLGKLLGNVGGSLTVLAIYAAGGYAAAAYNGWTDRVPWGMLPWFIVFQVLAVLLFSSVFMAVGAAVSQLKEAQSLLLPVWMLMLIPMFVWLPIAREPNGTLATMLSFFPPSAPLVMVLRLGSEEVIPAWQVALSLTALAATTAAITYLAGRIFRVGMLWQGKTPKLSELARWAWSG
ncbi:MAG TPA: ABC transporter permease [Lacipirellulaceae bacterium]|nr:ABC transporter permease [Lacipirellulaceae bacterium]HMP05278.1 ABC transporter permease [Lacipirellulaceae bacterium]